MSKARRLLIAALSIAAGTAGACVSAQDSPKLARDGQVPFGLLKPDAPALVPTSTALSTESVLLCFVTDDKLAAVERPLSAPVSLTDVVQALVEPPTADPRALRTAVDQAGLVSSVRLQAGVVQVDLNDSVASLGGGNQLLAIAQLVCTLTSRPGVGQVAFSIGDTPIEVPRGDGSLTADAVSRDDYRSLL